MKSMFEILVPTASNSKRSFDIEHHHKFDDFVKGLCGGLTILKSGMGYWVDHSGETYRERMIPVRIVCTEAQIVDIARFALGHYSQKAIMYYQISNNVVVIE